MNASSARQLFPNGMLLEIAQGDITNEHVDAIVNAANERLQHGGGVAHAIARAGGEQVQLESDAWVNKHGPATHSHPAVTTAGRLPASWIIHAVGPVWGSGQEEKKLADAVHASLSLADSMGLRSIALPAISTGIFGFPIQLAARTTLQAVGDFAGDSPHSLRLVRVVLHDRPVMDVFMGALHDIFGA